MQRFILRGGPLDGGEAEVSTGHHCEGGCMFRKCIDCQRYVCKMDVRHGCVSWRPPPAGEGCNTTPD